jgi:hypothetical protein
LTDEEDNLYERVSAWSGEFSGDIFEGELEKNDKGFWRIKKPKTGLPAQAGNPNFKTQQIKEAMDTKRQDVARSMDRKDISIKISSTMRDAVQLAIAEGQPNEETIEKWRAWLWTNWDKEDKDFPPFK